MKFLFITEFYEPFGRGGAEISLKSLVELLVEHGNYVTILTPNYESYENKISSSKNLKIIRFKSIRKFLFSNQKQSNGGTSQPGLMFYLIHFFYAIFSAVALRFCTSRVLKENAFDYIHANNYESTLAIASLQTGSKKLCHLRDFGLISIDRGMNDFITKSWKDKILFKMLDFLNNKKISYLNKNLPSFHKIIAISGFVKDRYLTKIKTISDKISIIYNPVNANIISTLNKSDARKKLGFPIKSKIVLFVGTLNHDKGAHLINDIASALPETIFVVIGKGPLSDSFLMHNIKYVGHLSSIHLRDYMKACDILLVPSLWQEPMGRVILEGHYNGAYILGSDRGAIPELIDHIGYGKLVSPTTSNFIQEIEDFKPARFEMIMSDYYVEFMDIVR